MENEFDNSGEWLKRKLQDAEPVWSEDAWNDFENRRNKKRSGIFWMYVTLTTFLLAIGSVLLYNNTNNTPLSEIKDSKKEVINPANNSKAIISPGSSTNPTSPSVSPVQVYHPAPFHTASPTSVGKQNIPTNSFAANNEPVKMDINITEKEILATNSSAINNENTIAEKEPTKLNIPTTTEPKIEETPKVVQPPVNNPIEHPKADKPKSDNDKPSKPHIKKTYIGLEYNPSQILLANDISLASTKYVSASIYKNAAMLYHNYGVFIGRLINKQLSIQTGINIYNYSSNLNYIEQTEHIQRVALPYTTFRMDTFLRRINMHTDTIYTTVKNIQNENRQTKVQLQYISIPFNVLYHITYKSTQIGIGGGLVIHHLRNTPTATDYDSDIKISPWKMNANIQVDAGWKLYKSVSIYTGYNFGYGISNKTNYIQHGIRTGLRISL